MPTSCSFCLIFSLTLLLLWLRMFCLQSALKSREEMELLQEIRGNLNMTEIGSRRLLKTFPTNTKNLLVEGALAFTGPTKQVRTSSLQRSITSQSKSAWHLLNRFRHQFRDGWHRVLLPISNGSGTEIKPTFGISTRFHFFCNCFPVVDFSLIHRNISIQIILEIGRCSRDWEQSWWPSPRTNRVKLSVLQFQGSWAPPRTLSITPLSKGQRAPLQQREKGRAQQTFPWGEWMSSK